MGNILSSDTVCGRVGFFLKGVWGYVDERGGAREYANARSRAVLALLPEHGKAWARVRVGLKWGISLVRPLGSTRHRPPLAARMATRLRPIGPGDQAQQTSAEWRKVR